MKKILISLSIIGAVAAIAVGGTIAYFSDTEISTGNTFTAGKLDLELNNYESAPINIANMAPGDADTATFRLTNTDGSLDGSLDIRLANLVQSENGIIEPELAAGDYENGGDLHLTMGFAAYLDVDKDGIFNAGDVQLTYDGQQRVYPGFWGGDFHYHGISSMMNGGWNDIMTLTENQSVDLIIMWQLPTTWTYPNYNQNIVQTDTLGFDVQTSLEQVGGSGGVTE